MRRFVVTNPNLSVGKSGSIVDADEMYMDDDQLDAWCDAGYGMELFDDTAIGDVITHMSNAIAGSLTEDEPDYDPSTGSVEQVRHFVNGNPSQADKVIQAERDGKNRSGIVNGW